MKSDGELHRQITVCLMLANHSTQRDKRQQAKQSEKWFLNGRACVCLFVFVCACVREGGREGGREEGGREEGGREGGRGGGREGREGGREGGRERERESMCVCDLFEAWRCR